MDVANTNAEKVQFKTLWTLMVNRFQQRSAWLWSAVLIAVSLVGVVGTSVVPGLETAVARASAGSVKVSSGDSHTCILEAGAVKCWGENSDGQLGLGDTADRGDGAGEMGDNLLAVDLGTGVTATNIATGYAHTCVLTSVGAVKCWGDNFGGQLGLGDTDSRGDGAGEMGDSLPAVDLGTGVTATAIATGLYHTCALTSVGVKCWGDNSLGQLGLGNTTNLTSPSSSSIDLGSGVTATAIATGDLHTCALTSVGVKCWGNNADGELGLGDTAHRGDGAGEMGDSLPAVDLGSGVTATAIATGAYHTCALTSVGVKCWGYNSQGQLGLGDTTNLTSPSSSSIDLGSGVTVTAISAGYAHTCALTSVGAVKCWGTSSSGQLGYGDGHDRGDGAGEMGASLPAVNLGSGVTATAIAVGSVHTCAMTSVGVKCWGDNDSGRLGLGDTTSRGFVSYGLMQDLVALDLGSGVTATAIAAGANYTCALTSGGVKCWGHNDAGQLGLGDTAHRGNGAGEMGDSLPAVNLGSGVTATAIAAGSSHMCVLTSGGEVKCWGLNMFGQLGLGNTATRTSPSSSSIDLGSGVTATAIAGGDMHTCALTSDGVKCWGYNAYGRLGYGDSRARGDGAGEMGDSLPAIDLGTGVTATAITAGDAHTCVLTSVGAVKCWGYNASGQLGLGDTAHRGDGAGEMGNSLPAVDLGSGVTATAIAANGTYTCALTSVGAVKCWGGSSYGELGLGDTTTRTSPSSTSIDLGSGVTATAIEAGMNHACALTSGGAVKCWGYNMFGQLGLGNTATRTSPSSTSIDLGSGVTATAIATGAHHTCALTSVGVKCWGRNQVGQLGSGSTLPFGGEETQMGDSLPVSYAVRALSTPSTPVVTTPVVTTPVVTTPVVTTPAVDATPRATIRTSRIPGNGRLVKISKFPPARTASAVGMKVSTNSISMALARPNVAPKLRPASYSISLIPLNGKKHSMQTLIPNAAKNVTSTVFSRLQSGRYEMVVVANGADGRPIGRWKSPQIRVVNGMSNKK